MTSHGLELIARGLRAVLEPVGPSVVVLAGDQPLLPPLSPRLPTALADLFATGRRAHATGEVRRTAGLVHRAELLAWRTGGPAVRWCVELDADGQGLTATLAIEQRGTAPVELDGLVPLVAAALPAGLACEVLYANARGARESLSLADAPGGGSLVFGFTSARVGFGRFEARGGELLARCEAPARLLPGEAVTSDRAFIGRAASPGRARAAWASRAGHDMDSGQPRRAAASGGLAPQMAPGRAVSCVRLDGSEAADAASFRRDLMVRREALDEGTLLASSGPLVAASGVADAYRPSGDPMRVAWAAQRLWLLETDLGTSAERPDAAAETTLAMAGLVSGLVRTPDAASQEATKRLGRALPPLGRTCWSPRHGILVVGLVGERLAVVLSNTTREPKPLGLRLSEIDRAGRHHVYDFFANRDLGITDEAVAALPVAPSGCRLLALTPVAGRAQVVGSSLHVGMGTAEVAALRAGGLQLVLALRHPGRHDGDVWIALPGEAGARRVGVRFEDRIDLELRFA